MEAVIITLGLIAAIGLSMIMARDIVKSLNK